MQRILIFLWIVICLPAVVSAQSEWKEVRNKNGIIVYTRKQGNSKIKTFKAISKIEATFSSIIAVMRDVPRYPEWVSDCKQSRLLKDINPQEMHYYLEIKVPFPFDNRDMVQHFNAGINATRDTLLIALTNQPDLVEEKENLVRMPIAHGHWKFAHASPGVLVLEFQYHSDPGGNLPAWLVNSLLANSPYNTILNLKKMVKKDKYRNASYPWIIN